MKVIGEMVLVQQVMVKKKSLLLENTNEDAKDNFEISFEIKGLGLIAQTKAEQNGVKIGDFPIFRQHVVFEANKVVHKDKDGMLIEVIIHFDDIIGIEEDLPIIKYKDYLNN